MRRRFSSPAATTKGGSGVAGGAGSGAGASSSSAPQAARSAPTGRDAARPRSRRRLILTDSATLIALRTVRRDRRQKALGRSADLVDVGAEGRLVLARGPVVAADPSAPLRAGLAHELQRRRLDLRRRRRAITLTQRFDAPAHASALRRPLPRWPAQESRRQKDNGSYQLQHAIDGDAQQAEGQEQQPDDGVQNESDERQRPAEHEEDQPEGKRGHLIGSPGGA